MQANEKCKKLCWHLFVLAVASFLIGGILIYTRTLQSGYHFMDDHEVERFAYKISVKGQSIFHVIKQQIGSDLRWRYRPVYWVERVILAALFGNNMFLWNLYTAVKGIITFLLLSYFVKYLKFDKWICILFPGVILLGAQFTPWYRSANQENTGLFLTSLILFLLAVQHGYEEKHKKYHNKEQEKGMQFLRHACFDAGIAVLAILCGMVKESFTLFLPLFLWMKFWLGYETLSRSREKQKKEKQKQEKQKQDFLSIGWKLFREGAFFYVPVILSLGMNVCIILFYVKTDQVSYAGFGQGTGLNVYLWGIKKTLLQYTKWYTLFGAVAVLFMILGMGKATKRQMVETGLFSAGVLAVCAVQIVVHAKSLMVERYMLPYMVSWAILFVLVVYRKIEKTVFLKPLFLMGLCCLMLMGTMTSYRMSKAYALDGQNIAAYFEQIIKNTEEKETIIGAYTDRELNLATEIYLQTHGRTKTGSFSPQTGEFESISRVVGKRPKTLSWDNARVIACYGEQVEDVLGRIGTEAKEEIEIQSFGRYVILMRRPTTGEKEGE